MSEARRRDHVQLALPHLVATVEDVAALADTGTVAWKFSTDEKISSGAILICVQTPLRKTYQSLLHDPMQSAIKGPYPIFDNVTALFSATPVITRF